MKAIRVHEFGGPDVLKIEEVDTPTPSLGQVVVRTHAIGVNPVDTYLRTGQYTFVPELPYTPGKDAAGVVESVGDGVSRFKSGDRVYIAGCISGAYAELVLCEEWQVHALPDRSSFAQGAAIGVPYVTAHVALFRRANAQPGETVLIHGASGGVGTAATQLARAAGLTVIGTASTEAGRKLVIDNGAHHVLNHLDHNYIFELNELTNGRGVDLIIEMLANVNLGRDLEMLALGGRVTVVGSRGPVEINPRFAMSKNASIHGMSLLTIPPQTLSGVHAAIVAGLENGTLQPVIAREFPLSQAAQSHIAVMEPGAHGKIVLVP